MNLKPATLGAEPKKLVFLVILVAAAGYLYFSNRDSTSASVPATTAAPGLNSAAAVERATANPAARAKSPDRGVNSSPKEFRPSLKNKDVDPSTIDPTLHLDELAKLRDVQPEVGTRSSLFEISSAPPAEVAKLEPAKIVPKALFVGPVQPAPPSPPPDPKAPPIPLKFYGFVNPSKADTKRAFFLDGEDIIIASEGDLIKKRYKIIRIGVNSAVVEDTQFKSNNQQTLPLEAEMAG
ncbi:MAG TPA: hypothetical protein VEV17_26430 [Bryobacteraceae bacterium]|nr:hypothetical protein [Bryobacteraceae bacterium]